MAGSAYTLRLKAKLSKDRDLEKEVRARVQELERLNKLNIKVSMTKDMGKATKATISYKESAKEAKKEILSLDTATEQYNKSLRKLVKTKEIEKAMNRDIANLKRKGIEDISSKKKYDTVLQGVTRGTIRYTDVTGKAVSRTYDYTRASDRVTARLRKQATQTDKTTKSTNYFAEGLVQSLKSAARYLIIYEGFRRLFSEINKGVDYIKELDKEMTAIQVVGDYTDETIQQLAVSYNGLAKELGRTTLQVAQGSLEFIRQGKTVEETTELIRQSSMMAQLGNLSAQDSTEKLTAVMNAFGVEAKDVGRIVDSLVQVDNVAATSIDEISTALQKSSFSAQSAGVDFHHLVAYISAVSSQTRLSAETIGTAFKTMFARYMNVSQGTYENQEEAINDIEKALQAVNSETGENIEILDRQTGKFRSFTDVMEDLSSVWSDLSDPAKSLAAGAFAGVRQQEIFLATMESTDEVARLYEESLGAVGTATERYAIYLESIEGSQNKAKASFEALWQETIEGDWIKWVYDSSAAIAELLTALGGLDALLPTIIAGFVTWGVVSGNLVAVLGTIFSASFLNPVGLAVTAVSALTLGITALNKKMNNTRDIAVSEWSEAMDVVFEKTDSTVLVVKNFVDEVERLNKLSPWEQFKMKKGEVVEEQLTSVLDLLAENSDSWDEYSSSVMEVADAAGYFVDESGRLYKLFNINGQMVRKYRDENDALTKTLFEASKMTDSWSGRLEDLTTNVYENRDAIVEARRQVVDLADSFNNLLWKSVGALDEITPQQDKLLSNLIQTNDLFLSGATNTETYFSQLANGFEGLDIDSLFPEDGEGKEIFITGAITNAISGIQKLTEEFNDPENTEGLAEYSQNLVSWGESFVSMIDMLDDVEGFENIGSEIGLLQEGMQGLSDANEAMVWSQQLLMELENESLQFGTTVYNERMEQYSKILAQSGQVYTDHMGNVLKSQSDIYGYLIKDSGNAQLLMEQVANQGGNSINKMKFAAGKMLVELGKAISNFDAKIDFQANPIGMDYIIEPGGWLAKQINNGQGIGIPSFTYEIGGNIGAGVISAGQSLMESAGGQLTQGPTPSGYEPQRFLNEDNPLSQFGIESFGTEGAGEEYDKLAGTVGTLTNALEELSNTSGSSKDQIEEDAKSIDKLLDIVVDKIKQEQKARKEALKDQLSDYKDIINTRKDYLKSLEKEHDYQKKLEKKESELSNIKSEMEELRLDDSEAAQARLRQLEEEAAQLQEEIDEEQYDRNIELQEGALDEEFENFEDYIDEQIESIDKYLSQPGQIVSDALSMINEGGQELYDQLIDWNATYGSGIAKDVTSAWDDAYEAISRYAGGLGFITGNNIGAPNFNDLGLNEAISSISLSSIWEGDVQTNFSSGINIDRMLDINVQGNLDKDVLPDIERIANMTIDKINHMMKLRGHTRDARQFSI